MIPLAAPEANGLLRGKISLFYGGGTLELKIFKRSPLAPRPAPGNPCPLRLLPCRATIAFLTDEQCRYSSIGTPPGQMRKG